MDGPQIWNINSGGRMIAVLDPAININLHPLKSTLIRSPHAQNMYVGCVCNRLWCK